MAEMTIISWNVNGIRAVANKGFLDWLEGARPEVLCVQETKAQPEQVPAELREFDGYLTWFCSAVRKGYSGVGLWSRPEPKKVTSGLGVERFDVEGRVQVADYGEFLLYNIYFPNGGASAERLRYKLDFYDELLAHLKKVKRRRKNILICGDVNTAHQAIDLARPKANEKVSGFLPEERAWIDELLAAGFVDTFRMFDESADQYSWWDYKTRARERNVGWRIDYFFVSEGFKDRVAGAFIMPEVMGSDHCPVGVTVQV